MLIATLSYSQASYPKKLILNNDTIVGITPDQLTKINQVFSYSELLKEDLDIQNERIEKLTIINKQQSSTINKVIQNVAYLSHYSDSLTLSNTNIQLRIERQKKLTKMSFLGGIILSSLIFIVVR